MGAALLTIDDNLIQREVSLDILVVTFARDNLRNFAGWEGRGNPQFGHRIFYAFIHRGEILGAE